MMPMRYHFLECTDEKRIHSFLTAARVGHLGLAQNNQPYVVPLNYVWFQRSIYFHGADKGRKVDMMEANSHVCFTVSEEYGTMANPVPAKTDTAYMSVMVFGTVQRVTDQTEARAALQAMLDKYVPGYYSGPLLKGHVEGYRSRLDSPVSVFRIAANHLSAKENPLHDDMKFYPGREMKTDVGPKRGTVTDLDIVD